MTLILEKKLSTYTQARSAAVIDCLGVGTQGSVYRCQVIDDFGQPGHISAVKIHHRDVAYNRELSVYSRLKDVGITEVFGHRVPIHIGHDDDLLAIEMTIASPPFCLDFGGVYLDRPPDYTPEVWRDWREQKSEDFEENWPVVQEILAEFESFGVYIADVNPGNIRFKNHT